MRNALRRVHFGDSPGKARAPTGEPKRCPRIGCRQMRVFGNGNGYPCKADTCSVNLSKNDGITRRNEARQ